MSNDTTFNIRLRGPTSVIKRLVEYLEEKETRWDAFERCNLQGGPRKAAFEEAMRKAGATKPADFATWGFSIRKRTAAPRGRIHVELAAWANENAFNVPISGEDGELACLQARFPEVTIEAEFRDDYGEGDCGAPSFVKCYSSWKGH
jgi:hypothetical protein